MDDEYLLTLKPDEDGMIDHVDIQMVPLDQMKMNVEEPIAVLGIEDEVSNLKESVVVLRDEEKKENQIEEVKNDKNPKDEVSVEEDPEEEMKNDENPKEDASIEEDPEEEIKNDENPEEEEKNEEDTKNEEKNEGKLEAISKIKANKLRKRSKMLKKKKIGLRKKVRNALVSTSKLEKDGWVCNVDTEMVPSDPVKMHGEESIISSPMLDTTDIPNDVGTGVVTSEKNGIVNNVDIGVATSKPVKINGEESYVVLRVKDKVKHPKESIMVLGDKEQKEREIGEMSNEENTKEEELNGGDTRNEAKAKEKLEMNSKKKVNKFRKIGKKKKKASRGKDEVFDRNRENPKYYKKKTTMKDESAGMIFMCSSKTKKDCYHYQVFGLPACKRDRVFEIYEGMKLFLFDYDLKLMYGIYEAVGPGGYNIEPKAFKAAFPSQVRFTILEDCLPLAEEKFKKIIKDNYYSKNKFDCQLNYKQVKELCSLFSIASNGSTSKWLDGSQQAEAPTFVNNKPKWPYRSKKAEKPQAEAPTLVDRRSKWPRRSRKAESRRAELPTFVVRESKRPRRSRKAETCTFVDPKPKQLHQSPRAETQEYLYRDNRHYGWEDERHHPFSRDPLYSEIPVAYRREVYESPAQNAQPFHLPLGSAVLPLSERYVYRRDQFQYHDLQPFNVELRRPRHEFEHRDSHIIPRSQDEFDHHGSYIAFRGHYLYHDPSSSVDHPSECYPPASRRPAFNYHLSAGPPPDYRPYRPVYRY